jgi:cytochrome P450
VSAMPDSSVGERYDPFGAHLADPYGFYAEARRSQPVFYAEDFAAWVVTRYDDIRYVLNHPRLFSSRNAVRPMTIALTPECRAELNRGYPDAKYFLNSDDTAHRRLKAPLIRGLGPRRVHELEPFIRKQINTVVDELEPAGHAELISQFTRLVPFRIIAQLVGIEESDYHHIQDGSFAASRLYRKGNLTPDEQLDYARRFVRYQHMLMRYIEARRADPRDDLITMFVSALAPGSEPLTSEQERELVWCLVGTLGAGSRAAPAAIGTALYHLLIERSRWEALVERPGLIANAVEEICRYDSPAQTFPRITTQPVTIGGVDLPTGTELIIIIGSANHDETRFDRAEELDITRSRTRHIAFGQGAHACIGAALARAQLRITLDTFTRRFPNLRLADGHDVEVTPAINQRQPRELHVMW